MIDPDQVRISEKEEIESHVACKSCYKSFDSDMEFITHEIEMHPISSWSEEVDTEEKMDCSENDKPERKRKWDCDGEMEAESDGKISSKRHKSVIETNDQFGVGRVEPEEEKNPQPEMEDDLEEDENNEYVDRSAFNGKLYARQFKPTSKKDISMAGKQYKVKIESLIRQQIEKSAVSFLWFTSVNGKI